MCKDLLPFKNSSETKGGVVGGGRPFKLEGGAAQRLSQRVQHAREGKLFILLFFNSSGKTCRS